MIMIFWSGGGWASVCIKCSFVHLFACVLSCQENKYLLHIKKYEGKKGNNGIRKVKWNVGLEDQVEK